MNSRATPGRLQTAASRGGGGEMKDGVGGCALCDDTAAAVAAAAAERRRQQQDVGLSKDVSVSRMAGWGPEVVWCGEVVLRSC